MPILVIPLSLLADLPGLLRDPFNQLVAQCGKARAGTLTLPHGTFNTPAFMPVGTQVRLELIQQASQAMFSAF